MTRLGRALTAVLRASRLLALALAVYGVSLGLAWLGARAPLLDPALYRHGAAGAALFVLAASLLVGIGLPRQSVAFLGGYVFGAGWGAALALAAQGAGCLGNLLFARRLGRAWVRARLGERAAALDRFLARKPFATILMLRLLPVGNNLTLNLLAGITTIPARPFLLASLIGYLPQTLVFSLIGGGIRLERGTQIAVAVILFIVSGFLGWGLMQSHRRDAGTSALPGPHEAAADGRRVG
jgi:uncharacterized membrane protein YdjX (TVP38/TMEM64 family)